MERINDVVEAWAEKIRRWHDHYFIFEIGINNSRVSIYDLSLREELCSAIIDTPKYVGTEKPIKSEWIADSLLDKLVWQHAA